MRTIASSNLLNLFNKNLPTVGIFMFASFIIFYQCSTVLRFRRARVSPVDHQSNFISKTGLSQNNEWCSCAGFGVNFSNKNFYRSMCNQRTDLRGFNQSVVSYSLFGNPESDSTILKRYFSSIESRASRIAKVYPGWTMRVYHNLTDEQQKNYLCPVQCNYTNVDLCNVNEIQTKEFGSHWIRELNPRMWRFFVMLDPLVDRFISRDIDSEIIPRETATVRQWLQSNYTFHVMRDHPSHGGFMLAGLWGAKNHQRRSLIKRLGAAMVYSSQDSNYQTDQNRLDLVVWPFASFDVMAHDAYFCNTWLIKLGNVVPVFPFPTRRVKRNYTGLDLVRKDIADHIVPCPKECRPRNHKNWLYC